MSERFFTSKQVDQAFRRIVFRVRSVRAHIRGFFTSEVYMLTTNINVALRSLFFVFLPIICMVPIAADAATYSLSPGSGSYEVGKQFQVKVVVEPGADAVNTGEATISFDSTKLTAVSVSKDGSPFNLWVLEPSIKAGKIEFQGGATAPISGNKTVATITFKAKAEGTAEVKFDKASLLAGAGVNVLKGNPPASFTITPASAKPAPEPTKEEPKKETRAVNIPAPEAPVIKSSTHKDESLWYKESNVKITWDIPYGVTGLKIGFGTSSTEGATTVHEPPISDWSKDAVPDGVWYFTALYKNRGGWGSSTVFKLQIDTTPPEEFTASATGGDLAVQVRFETEDTLSGIALYRIAVDDGRARDIQPAELIAGGYTLTNLTPGEHSITVTAVDRAGNERESKATATVTGTLPPDETAAGAVKTSGFGAIYWVSLLFMAALAVVVTLLIIERRKHHEERDHIKRETMEAGDKLINIFGVLRDEIEEKVLELSHKPNMTDNERSILEALKDALDISEELIDKEIEDVRKLLK